MTQVGTGVVSYAHALAVAGLTPAALAAAGAWVAAGDSVVLRFRTDGTCTFNVTEDRDVDRGTHSVVRSGIFRNTEETVKYTSRVKMHHWTYVVSWALELVRGTGRAASGDVLSLGGRTAVLPVVVEGNDGNPYSGLVGLAAPLMLRLPWLIRQLDLSGSAGGVPVTASFAVNRSSPTCHTPSVNDDVEAALVFGRELGSWATGVTAFFRDHPFLVAGAETLALSSSLKAGGLFVPTALFDPTRDTQVAGGFAPTAHTGFGSGDASASRNATSTSPVLLATPSQAASRGTASALLDVSSVNLLLAEARAGLIARVDERSTALPPASGPAPITAAEAALLVALDYLYRAADLTELAVMYIGDLLRSQVRVPP